MIPIYSSEEQNFELNSIKIQHTIVSSRCVAVLFASSLSF